MLSWKVMLMVRLRRSASTLALTALLAASHREARAQTITVFDVGSDANPYWITNGPDGNLWFTEGNAGRISRISPAGQVARFVIPAQYGAPGYQSVPSYITPGPDGNLWFSQYSGGTPTTFTAALGRITPSGLIAEFPTDEEVIGGVTTGPDGNLWFGTSSSIKRVTPLGSFWPPSSGPTSRRRAHSSRPVQTAACGSSWGPMKAPRSAEQRRLGTKRSFSSLRISTLSRNRSPRDPMGACGLPHSTGSPVLTRSEPATRLAESRREGF